MTTEPGERTVKSDMIDPETESTPAGLDSDARPVLATRDDNPVLGSLRLRMAAFAVLLLAGLGWLAFGTVNARNVYFNVFVDEGRYNGIGRFTRETVVSVWTTMWDRTPDFGSIELTRLIVFGSAAAFVVAAIVLVYVVLVPSAEQWADDLGTGRVPDQAPGD